MDSVDLALNIAVFGAALLQAATGMGFGIIAGPILLMALDAAAAVQISIVLSLLNALALAPPVWSKTDRPLLRRLFVGTLIGLPLGIAIYLAVSLGLLKVLAGAAVLLMALFVYRAIRPAGARSPARPSPAIDVGVGVISGVMCAAFAMPGPLPAARMAARGVPKETMRATMLTLFVASYIAALILQAAAATIARSTLWTAASLVPAALAGLLCGRALTSRISERVFKFTILTILAATGIGLLVNGASQILDG